MLRRGSSLLSSLLRPKERLVPDDMPAPEPPAPAETPTYAPRYSGASLLADTPERTPSDRGFIAPEVGVFAPAGAQNNELILQSFDDDLLKLVNLTQSTLTRALRPQTGGGSNASVLGPLQKGIEIAERIEQRGRSLLLETSLTAEQRPRVLCATQNAGDQSVALRSARYAWQTCAILTAIPGGSGTFARVKRLVTSVTELSGKVSAVLESGRGTEKAVAAEAAAQYRAVLGEQSEIVSVLRHDISAPPLARRLGRAAVMSLVIAAESMTRVAARLAYPESAANRSVGPQRLGVNDGILRPLPLR